MTGVRFLKGVGATIAIGVLVGMVVGSKPVRADDDNGDSRIARGFEIAPVPLNLVRKNRALVGLGSYLVNGVSGCNGCHSAGPQTEFTPTGNPYFLSPPFSGQTTVNRDTYLGGGRIFPPLNIVSRNLTPDKTGLAIGGDTFEEFRNTIRTGVDPDNLHPVLPAPLNGALLQIMPWPTFQNMDDHDLRAMYEYLSAIPCIAGPPAPSPLHHDCF
jgi:hypothetical protein